MHPNGSAPPMQTPVTSTSRPTGMPPVRPTQQSGAIIIWALLTTFVVGGIVLAATDEIRAIDRVAEFEFSTGGQAEEVAQAGLTDALAWFRRQTSQPVLSFEPVGLPPSQRAINATPGEITVTPAIQAELDSASYYSIDKAETELPEVGLVRTFEMAPGIWARYTVTRGTAAESFVDANLNGLFDKGESYSDTNGDKRWTGAEHSVDVSAARGLEAPGTVWHLTSYAEVFKRPRLDLPVGESPNIRIATSLWGTEIRRLTIAPPSAAALCASVGSDVVLGSRTRVRGISAVAYGEGTGTPSYSNAEMEGAVTSVPDFKTGHVDVFGVDWPELMSMADISTVDPANGIPGTLPTNSLIVVTGDAEFSAERPLRGSAVVAVRGNVTLLGGSNPFFSGVLYVDGDLYIRGPALVRGITIATGSVDVRGGGGDYVELEHDSAVLSALLRSIGQYRYAKAPFRIRKQ